MAHVFDYHAGIERNTLTEEMHLPSNSKQRERPPLKVSLQSVNSLPRSFQPISKKHMTYNEARWGYESGTGPVTSAASQRRGHMSFSGHHKKPHEMDEVPIPHEGKTRQQQAFDIAVWNMRGRQSSPARNRQLNSAVDHPPAFTAARTRAATPRKPGNNTSNNNMRSTRKLILGEDSYTKEDDTTDDILQYIDEVSYSQTATQQQQPQHSPAATASSAAPKNIINPDPAEFKRIREEAYRRAIAQSTTPVHNVFDSSTKGSSPARGRIEGLRVRSNTTPEKIVEPSFEPPMRVPEPLIEPGRVAKGGAKGRDESEFIRYNSFLLRSHLTSLFTMLFDDGWISQQERNSLNDLARCDNHELLGHVTHQYAQFVQSHDVGEFVTNLRAVLMTNELP